VGTVDEGTGEANCLAHQLTVDGGKQRLMIAVLRYYDTCAKMDGHMALCGAPALRRLAGGARTLMIATKQVVSMRSIAAPPGRP
jgi:hypothetical protein